MVRRLPASRETVVFCGLSLCLTRASALCSGRVRGPVRHGDLDRIASPATVAIIDGVLDSAGKLSAREVERAIARGLRVYGAASAGALLACKLHANGVTGRGRVFDFLRSFDGDRANLVALLYRPASLTPVTTPLINAVIALEDAILPSWQRFEAMQALTEIPLWDRSPEIVEIALRGAGAWPLHISDQKAGDALALLTELSRIA